MTQMAKWKEISDIGISISTPSPEAIVRAALELAADRVVTRVEKRGPAEYRCGISGYSNGIDACFDAIRSLASDPAEVAAILEEAKKERG
jgi:hypothetical protein